MGCMRLVKQDLEDSHLEMLEVLVIPMVVGVLEEEMEVARVEMVEMNLLAKDFLVCCGSCIWDP